MSTPSAPFTTRNICSNTKHICIDYSIRTARALPEQVPAKQLPDGHVVPSALLVAPTHTPVAGLHVPGLRQGPACAVQSRPVAAHKSADYSTNTVTQGKNVSVSC
jgi:hypothetical protein